VGQVAELGAAGPALVVDEQEVELLGRVVGGQRQHQGLQQLALAGAGGAADQRVRALLHQVERERPLDRLADGELEAVGPGDRPAGGDGVAVGVVEADHVEQGHEAGDGGGGAAGAGVAQGRQRPGHRAGHDRAGAVELQALVVDRRVGGPHEARLPDTRAVDHRPALPGHLQLAAAQPQQVDAHRGGGVEELGQQRPVGFGGLVHDHQQPGPHHGVGGGVAALPLGPQPDHGQQVHQQATGIGGAQHHVVAVERGGGRPHVGQPLEPVEPAGAGGTGADRRAHHQVLGAVQAGGLGHQRPAGGRHLGGVAAQTDGAHVDHVDGDRHVEHRGVVGQHGAPGGLQLLVALALDALADVGGAVAEAQPHVEQVAGDAVALPQAGHVEGGLVAQLGQVGGGDQTDAALLGQGGVDLGAAGLDAVEVGGPVLHELLAAAPLVGEVLHDEQHRRGQHQRQEPLVVHHEGEAQAAERREQGLQQRHALAVGRGGRAGELVELAGRHHRPPVRDPVERHVAQPVAPPGGVGGQPADHQHRGPGLDLLARHDERRLVEGGAAHPGAAGRLRGGGDAELALDGDLQRELGAGQGGVGDHDVAGDAPADRVAAGHEAHRPAGLGPGGHVEGQAQVGDGQVERAGRGEQHGVAADQPGVDDAGGRVERAVAGAGGRRGRAPHDDDVVGQRRGAVAVGVGGERDGERLDRVVGVDVDRHVGRRDRPAVPAPQLQE
jgi:hypothetical protein